MNEFKNEIRGKKRTIQDKVGKGMFVGVKGSSTSVSDG